MFDSQLLKMVAITIQERIKNRIRQNRITPQTQKSGGTTLVESARLLNSINHKIDGDTIVIGTNVRYARIHHEGGIIKPVRAKFLAIPIAKVAKTLSPRDFDNTFIRNGIIYRALEDDKVEALYSLKKQVRILARFYMFIDQSDRNLIKDRVNNYIVERIKNGL